MSSLSDTHPSISTADQTSSAKVMHSRAITLGLIALVLLGMGLRVWQYRMNRSLWLDESMLSLNILGRTPAELFKPLDLDQGAPVGFLLLEKWCVSLLGPGEYALRLTPLVFGLAGMALFAILVRCLLKGPAGLFVTAIYALSCPLVYYSAETKQYGLDLTIGMLISLVGLYASRQRYRGLSLGLFLLVGAAAMFFSHASVFVLAGVGGAMLIDARSDQRAFRGLVLVAVAMGVVLLANYLFRLRPLTHQPALLKYWRKGFVPVPPRSVFEMMWMYDALVEFFDEMVGLFRSAALGLTFASIGVVAIFHRRQWPLLVALLGPGMLVVLASALHKYPFNGRLILFLAAPALILAGRGLQMLFEELPGKWRATGVIVGLVLLADPTAEAFRALHVPIQKESMRDALKLVLGKARPDDLVLIGSTAEYQYTYYRRYSKSLGWENSPPVVIIDPSSRAEQYPEHRQIWLVFSHYFPSDVEKMLDEVETRDHFVSETRVNETRIFCYAPGAQKPGAKRRPRI